MKSREVVILRASGEMPVMSTYTYGEGARLIAMNVDHVDPPRCRTSGVLLDPHQLPPRLAVARSRRGDRPLLASWIDPSASSLVSGVVTEVSGTMRRVQIGSTVLCSADRLRRDPQASARLARALADLRAERRLVDIELRLFTGDGGQPARARLPLRAGEACALALGIEGLELADIDIEVAQAATTPDPVVLEVFEGLALWLRPSFGPSGDLVLELQGGGGVRVGEPARIQLASYEGDMLEQTIHDHVFVRERLVFRQDASGPWRATLGEAGGMRLEIEVAR